MDFNRSWKTARFHNRELRRAPAGYDGNFVDVDSGERFWLSGPKRDRSDTRYGPDAPTVDDDVRDTYREFLAGGPLPGRVNG